MGASGGGAFVLAAQGLLQVIGGRFNVSAASVTVGGAGIGGQAGASGTAGAVGGGGGAGASPGGGSGGVGGLGGQGGSGGGGGQGGTGGQGGASGYGTPGMIKLMGSVVLAENRQVQMLNVATDLPEHNGKFTRISNMSPDALAVHGPTYDKAGGIPTPVIGETRYDALLTANNPLLGVATPKIPQLTGGPAAAGCLSGNYWNKTDVDALIPGNGKLLFTVLRQISAGGVSVYDGYDQVVVKNSSLSTLDNIVISVNGAAPVPLPSTPSGIPGQLAAAAVWTTTVPAGAVVLVCTAPAIAPLTQSVNYGADAQFTVTTADTDAGLTYLWRHNGVDLANDAGHSGVDTPQLSVLSCENAEEGVYTCMVTEAGVGSTEVSAAGSGGTLTVLDPAITGQPADQIIRLGEQATFSVTAVGTSLSYEWFKVGNATVLGTALTLTINNMQESDAGDYYCRVTGADGPRDSDAANLRANDPSIRVHPSGATVNPGQAVTFTLSVGTTSTKPITYQWYRNGLAVAAAGGSGTLSGAGLDIIYAIPSAVYADEGAYTCTLTGAEAVVTSNPASLIVRHPPMLAGINSTPTTGISQLGFNALLMVQVLDGTGPLTYAWTKNGQPIAEPNVTGLGNATLVFASVQQANEGLYRCTVTNLAGSAYTEKNFYVGSLLTFYTNPASLQLYYGDSANFQVVVAGGLGTKYYQWFREVAGVSTSVPNTTPALHLSNLAAGNAGNYYCVVTDQRGSHPSAKGTLTLAAPLTPVVSLPETDTATDGSAYSLRVTTSGGYPPVSYEWQRNGVHVDATNSYANGSELVLDPVEFSDAGVYTMNIVDQFTESLVQTCTLTVSQALPLGGLGGLIAVAGAVAAAGGAFLRKRRR